MSGELPIQMFDLPRVKRSYKRRAHTNVLICMPDAVLEKLRRFAEAGYRSTTAEVVMRLTESVANESIDEHGCIVVHAKPSSK